MNPKIIGTNNAIMEQTAKNTLNEYKKEECKSILSNHEQKAVIEELTMSLKKSFEQTSGKLKECVEKIIKTICETIQKKYKTNITEKNIDLLKTRIEKLFVNDFKLETFLKGNNIIKEPAKDDNDNSTNKDNQWLVFNDKTIKNKTIDITEVKDLQNNVLLEYYTDIICNYITNDHSIVLPLVNSLNGRFEHYLEQGMNMDTFSNFIKPFSAKFTNKLKDEVTKNGDIIEMFQYDYEDFLKKRYNLTDKSLEFLKDESTSAIDLNLSLDNEINKLNSEINDNEEKLNNLNDIKLYLEKRNALNNNDYNETKKKLINHDSEKFGNLISDLDTAYQANISEKERNTNIGKIILEFTKKNNDIIRDLKKEIDLLITELKKSKDKKETLLKIKNMIEIKDSELNKKSQKLAVAALKNPKGANIPNGSDSKTCSASDGPVSEDHNKEVLNKLLNTYGLQGGNKSNKTKITRCIMKHHKTMKKQLKSYINKNL
jgi:hypothetical protein